MPTIRETILTTVGLDGCAHHAPIGLILEPDGIVIAPFRPSRTLDNLQAVPFAVANYTDDVRIFAGCLTGRRDWPTLAAQKLEMPRLAGALAHAELAVSRVIAHPQRPRFLCEVVAQATHAPFTGFSRAKAAVIEAAILVSRLELLPREQIEAELARLAVAVEKTADRSEREAFDWLLAKVRAFYDQGPAARGSAAPS